MLKLETAKMTNAIKVAKAHHPMVWRAGENTYGVVGSHGDVYTVKLVKEFGKCWGECDCKATVVCYHIAAACSLHVGIKRGYSKESPAPRRVRRGILITNSHAGHIETPVEVLGETNGKRSYEIRAIVDTKLGGRNHWLQAGKTAQVPKSAVKLNHPLADIMVKQEGNGVQLEGGMWV